MTAPHPQRCKTCLHGNCDWNYAHSEIGEFIHEFTAKFGCASHSTARKDSDVLDELEDWVNNKWEFLFKVLPYNNAVTKVALLEKIEQLRTRTHDPEANVR